MAPASSKEFLDIQTTSECGFTLKLVRDMIEIHNHYHNVNRTILCNLLSISLPSPKKLQKSCDEFEQVNSD